MNIKALVRQMKKLGYEQTITQPTMTAFESDDIIITFHKLTKQYLIRCKDVKMADTVLIDVKMHELITKILKAYGWINE
jgi:hypothetical protein